ncbi:MAG TPA: adenosine deaminase [Terriglobales bacterium]|jgi:aminodeoxyfutalosine deaminase|nr:adenosine deaminase [Terriglobales bacterium]
MGLFANPNPSAFVLGLPKAELHIHLEGAIEPATLLDIQHGHGLTTTVAEVEALYQYSDFTGFLMSFKNITEHLKTPADYELITYRLMERLKAENVLHAEVYISVGVCLFRKQNIAAIFEGLERGRARGERDFGVSLLWIFDAVRHFGSAEALRVAELAVQYQDRNVVGFGLGGDERKAGPELFREVYAYAAEHGLRLTAHAGETAGPESIWGALNLRAERIGHGLTAQQDPDLIQELAKRQIPVEICVTSNLKTGECPAIAEHPVRAYFDSGVMVTLNSDDPAMFGTSVAREYQLVQEQFGFTEEHLRELARNSFEAAFLPAEKKVEFLNLFDTVAART